VEPGGEGWYDAGDMRMRWTILVAVAAGWPWGPGAAFSAAAPRGTFQVTVASANLSDNTTQAYDEAGIRILRALQPDIVGIQEFNYRKGTAADLVYELFGPGYHFTRERGGARLPNGVISRWPILESGQWDDPYIQNRNFVWATVGIPGPKPLHVVSVHLASNRRDLRSRQARYLVRRIEEAFGRDAYVVLCGDMNVTSRDAEALGILLDVVDDSHQPADQAGNKNTNAARNRPYDYVLPNDPLDRCHVATVLNGRKFPDGMVFDSRLWNPPPSPAKWDDTARDMQHLPVMKTFAIPMRK